MASPAAAAQQRPWLSGERTKCTLSVEQCILSLKDFMPDPTVTDAWQNMNTDAIIEEYSKVLLSFAEQTNRVNAEVVKTALMEQFEISFWMRLFSLCFVCVAAAQIRCPAFG